MPISILIISTLLSWAVYDPLLFRRRRSFVWLSETSLSETEKLQQRKKILRDRLDVIPAGFRKARKPLRSRCNYFNTKARDPRFSNQRKIRRMFNNI